MSRRKGNKANRSIIRAGIFALLFLLCFHRSTYVLRYKMYENDTVGSFYREKRDSLDVVIVGTSHVYRGISPMEIWDERGIASYSLATGSQSFSSSYYLIKDAIKTQHPKVIVLEVYGANYTGDYVSLARLHASTDGIPLNATKLELFQELLPRTLTCTESLEFIFPIIAYHSRWEELEEKDFHPMNTFLKGFLMDYDTAQQSEPETTAETSRIYKGTKEYFDKIVDICKENQVELILCQTPSSAGDDYSKEHRKVNTLMIFKIIKEEQKQYRKVLAI